MRRIVTFPIADYEKANKFIEQNGATSQQGVHVTGTNIVIMYDDGKVNKGAARHIINETMSEQKRKLITLRELELYWTNRIDKLKAVKNKPEYAMLPFKEQREVEQLLGQAEESWKMQASEKKFAEEKIASCEAALKEIDAGKFIQ